MADIPNSALPLGPPLQLLTVVIPGGNEEGCLAPTIGHLDLALTLHHVPHEIVVVDDGSADRTWGLLQELAGRYPALRCVQSVGLNGFGRAVVAGIDAARGDAVVVMMADESDDYRDVVRYWTLLNEGWDCVFGSRFVKGGVAIDYPKVKRVLNRLANLFIRLLFRIPYDDTTNAFKAYRTSTLIGCRPFLSPHFNLTVELPLKAVVGPTQAVSEFFVEYRFNALGCRGPDVPLPQPADRRRIPVLGDSYALGEGVHEPDTFAAKLETSLNRVATAAAPDKLATATAFAVVNCSVKGYSMDKLRQYYGLLAARYEPTIGLISLTTHDSRSWQDEMTNSLQVNRASSGTLFLTTQLFRSDPASSVGSFSPAAAMDVVALAEAVRANAARPVVLSFPNSLSGGSAGNLPTTLSIALETAKIPFLDVGPSAQGT